MKKLMLVLSNISFSSASVEYAIKKSEEEGYELITVFVLDEEIPESVSSLLMYIGFLGPKPTNDLKTTILEEYKKRAYSELERVEYLAKEKGLAIQKILREGRFVDEILAVQAEENATLVVASKPTAPLLSQVLTAYNMEELKEKLGDKLIIIEEQQ
jgi:nucleotide-binding universal stress UspA family protein